MLVPSRGEVCVNRNVRRLGINETVLLIFAGCVIEMYRGAGTSKARRACARVTEREKQERPGAACRCRCRRRGHRGRRAQRGRHPPDGQTRSPVLNRSGSGDLAAESAPETESLSIYGKRPLAPQTLRLGASLDASCSIRAASDIERTATTEKK